MSLRVIFMGSPGFAVPALARIREAGHEVAAVYSQPSRAAGRGMVGRPTAVHEFAAGQGFEMRTPSSLKSADEQARFAALRADVAVVAAYGLILPKAILEAPRHGCLNIHPSLLPRWRGAAPIQRAIMAGDAETGVSIMRMEEGLDTGPVCMAEATPLGLEETAQELHDRLAHLGAELMVKALAAVERGALDCRPQLEQGVTYARKIAKAEARIDWSRPAREVHDHIRGLSPFPGAWFQWEAGGRRERVKVLRSRIAQGKAEPGARIAPPMTIACGNGAVSLLQLQREGRKPMDAELALRGMQGGETVRLA
ncbi:MAG: methionyl-tRNA formyltransferase [Pseudomonadota bacterium]|nr:methionyl-tRNA formyltransferase [Pseudomonadota bacterium]